MSTRREFLVRAIATATAAGVGVATGLWHHRSTKPAAEPEPKPEPVNVEGEITVTYKGPFETHDLRITCIEILDEGVDPMTFRREVSWRDRNMFKIPEIGTNYTIEQCFDNEDIKTERFRATIVRVMEIK